MSKMHRDLKTQWQIAVSRLGRARKTIVKSIYFLMLLVTFGHVSNHYAPRDANGSTNVVGTSMAALVCGVGWPLYWAYRLQTPD
jgi:hypothetical protein